MSPRPIGLALLVGLVAMSAWHGVHRLMFPLKSIWMHCERLEVDSEPITGGAEPPAGRMVASRVHVDVREESASSCDGTAFFCVEWAKATGQRIFLTTEPLTHVDRLERRSSLGSLLLFGEQLAPKNFFHDMIDNVLPVIAGAHAALHVAIEQGMLDRVRVAVLVPPEKAVEPMLNMLGMLTPIEEFAALAHAMQTHQYELWINDMVRRLMVEQQVLRPCRTHPVYSRRSVRTGVAPLTNCLQFRPCPCAQCHRHCSREGNRSREACDGGCSTLPLH